MKRRLSAAALLATTLILAGCGQHSKSEIVLNVHRWQTGPYNFTLGCNDNPEQLDTEGIAMGITGADKQPLTHCTVTIDLSMPSMSMPKDTVTLMERHPGWYGGTCRFTMAGRWIMNLDVEHDGKSITTFILPVTAH